MKIAIVGYGIEGKSAYEYFKSMYPEAIFAIYDEATASKMVLPDGAELHLGQPIGEQSIDADIVVRSPAINPSHITTDGRITSVTKEFFTNCPAPIIGVTGTKGKGTTASLIHSILQAGGKKSWLVGNIGAPALDILPDVQPDDVVVYELSSFQLWDLDAPPQISVVLMIEPDHLDVHEGFTDYVEAKANIRRYQTDNAICVYDPTNEYSRYIALETLYDADERSTRPYGNGESSFAYVKENTFFVQGDSMCSVDSLQLRGEHNQRNACAAIAAAWDYVSDPEAIEKGLRAFEGLPHRLKFVREVGGVQYFDDSIATTPGSAIAAIKSFEQPKILILGGSDKGADFSELYEAIRTNGVKQVITIGTMGEKIARELREQGYETITELGMTDMDTIVASAAKASEPGDIVIMSPACASFDMFKSYIDRGERYVAAVNDLE